MLTRVDKKEDRTIEGFSYENKDGTIETVTFERNADAVQITTSTGMLSGKTTFTHVWIEDIPNLIKALQAAYDHKEA